MRRVPICVLSGITGFFLLAASAWAGKLNPADYPLRVHIVFRNSVLHYHGLGGGSSSLEGVDGMGGANLFENGEPRGFDFTYQCDQPLTPEPGFETFMARWKKPDRVIEILMPVIGGKPGQMNSCDLKVTLKPGTAYFRRNGGVAEEPAAAFKEWMVRHQYDPEHGKNEPVRIKAAQPGPGSNPTK